MALKNYLSLFLKGMGMGAANVIPGVSGGTIALITGIFEKLISSIKAFDLTALKLFFSGQFKKFADHINLSFLIAVFFGVAVSILSVARLFSFLFDNYPVYIWSFFFGLILASVYFVGKTIGKWNLGVVISFIIGTAIAVTISFVKPATENSSIIYLLLCGVVATCSMILPGLSGSFVLILMGNYRLVMIDAVNNLDLQILIPVIIGAAVGLIAFSHFLTWIFKKFKFQTLALLTGFILGSVPVLWPWKREVYTLDPSGELLLKGGEKIVEGYQWFMPSAFNFELFLALIIMILGVLVIWITETIASKNKN
jgi:putative membrane protein